MMVRFVDLFVDSFEDVLVDSFFKSRLEVIVSEDRAHAIASLAERSAYLVKCEHVLLESGCSGLAQSCVLFSDPSFQVSRLDLVDDGLLHLLAIDPLLLLQLE